MNRRSLVPQHFDPGVLLPVRRWQSCWTRTRALGPVWAVILGAGRPVGPAVRRELGRVGFFAGAGCLRLAGPCGPACQPRPARRQLFLSDSTTLCQIVRAALQSTGRVFLFWCQSGFKQSLPDKDVPSPVWACCWKSRHQDDQVEIGGFPGGQSVSNLEIDLLSHIFLSQLLMYQLLSASPRVDIFPELSQLIMKNSNGLSIVRSITS